MSKARLEHFIFGIVLWAVYLWLKQRRGERWLLHPVVFVATVPALYLGTALSDWDITVLGIGGHRNPLFHSLSHTFVWPGCGGSWALPTSLERVLVSPSMLD